MNGECVSCGGLTELINYLGNHRLPDFTDPGAPLPGFWPLKLVICTSCTLLQLNELTPRASLYHDRYGFKSGINEAIRADLEDVVKSALGIVTQPASWLDIGCNDGTLLSFVPQRTWRAGIDPLGQFAGEASQYADRIVTDYFKPEHCGNNFEVITSVSMFYDLASPGDFARDVRSVLAPHGVWVIQQNYALDMIRRNAIDNICHEHVTYFSVTALDALMRECGLEIFHVTYSAVNGGCFRAFVSREGKYNIKSSVGEALYREHYENLGRPAVWRRWAGDVKAELQKTMDFLTSRVTRSGNECYLYGASTRGGTFLQIMGAGPALLIRAVERSPAKVGKIMGSTGIPIISEEQMRQDDPEYLLVSPWFFRDVFADREAAYLDNGGRMIYPLPRFSIDRRP